MLDEYRCLYAEGNTIVRLTKRETIILLMFCIKTKNKEYLDLKEMEDAINKTLGTDISMGCVIAALNRIKFKLKQFGIVIKKRSKIGYYICRKSIDK